MLIKGRELLNRSCKLGMVNLATPFVLVSDMLSCRDQPDLFMKVCLKELGDQPDRPGCWPVVNLDSGWVTWMEGTLPVQVVRAHVSVDG